tara:strand:- start:242 stop:562 length:321 start_codon:yes stop_codon:yes gene_type:complete
MPNLKFNPFYIEANRDTCISDKDVLIINSFDVRNGESLLKHLQGYNMTRVDVDQLLNYLWFDMELIDRTESAILVKDALQEMAQQLRQGFGEIDVDKWLRVRAYKN